jgi:hypothetical protein
MLGRTLLCFLLTAVVAAPGCRQPAQQPDRAAAILAAREKLRSCLPEAEPEDSLKLAITAVTLTGEETSLRLVAYTIGEPADFYLPTYLMSRGRWLINEEGRAYLLDEECREYKLKGRRIPASKTVSPQGLVRLQAGQAFELTLSFPPLPETAQAGILIYGKRVLPFSLLTTAP